jgi:hypothetical protein
MLSRDCNGCCRRAFDCGYRFRRVRQGEKVGAAKLSVANFLRQNSVAGEFQDKSMLGHKPKLSMITRSLDTLAIAGETFVFSNLGTEWCFYGGGMAPMYSGTISKWSISWWFVAKYIVTVAFSPPFNER